MNDKRIVKEYLDIDGVKVVFKILKSKLDLSREELMSEIERRSKRLERKIDKLEVNLGDNYYTKKEVDSLLPDRLTEEEVDSAYEENNKN